MVSHTILNIIVTVIITTLTSSSLTYALVIKSKIKALFSSQCSQLRIQILEMSRRCMKKGEITYEELDALTKAYENYHLLGGNGTIDKVFHDVRELPLNNNKGE